jgi:hypothetical protein
MLHEIGTIFERENTWAQTMDPQTKHMAGVLHSPVTLYGHLQEIYTQPLKI